jgi:hypothetical protein
MINVATLATQLTSVTGFQATVWVYIRLFIWPRIEEANRDIGLSK